MIQGIVIWALTAVMTLLIVSNLGLKSKPINERFVIILFFYHTLLTIVYYLYALNNPSDSGTYFLRAVNKPYGDNLLDYFGASTEFINFIAFFLVNSLGFTYESCMVLFAWIGYLGFVCFCIFFNERTTSSHYTFGLPTAYLVLLLPNLHFWSSSLGKGSLIFCGFGLFMLGLSKPSKRLWSLILGGFLIFQIRPHIFYVTLIAVALGYAFSTKGVATIYRVLILGAAGLILYYINEDILKLAGLDEESILNPLMANRAYELTKATSGIDITNYNFFEKIFAFWFRPLFVDAIGALGFIVSFENLFYLIFFLNLLRPAAWQYLAKSDPVVRTCLFAFLGASIALAQISGNLGLALRQKSQVMLLMLFVIVKFLDDRRRHKQEARIRRRMQWQQRRMSTMPQARA